MAEAVVVAALLVPPKENGCAAAVLDAPCVAVVAPKPNCELVAEGWEVVVGALPPPKLKGEAVAVEASWGAEVPTPKLNPPWAGAAVAVKLK